MATKTFLSGLTIGAGLIYFLDPERGRLRRERFSRGVAPLLRDLELGLRSGTRGGDAGVLRYG